jgi:ferredoxin
LLLGANDMLCVVVSSVVAAIQSCGSVREQHTRSSAALGWSFFDFLQAATSPEVLDKAKINQHEALPRRDRCGRCVLCWSHCRRGPTSQRPSQQRLQKQPQPWLRIPPQTPCVAQVHSIKPYRTLLPEHQSERITTIPGIVVVSIKVVPNKCVHGKGTS